VLALKALLALLALLAPLAPKAPLVLLAPKAPLVLLAPKAPLVLLAPLVQVVLRWLPIYPAPSATTIQQSSPARKPRGQHLSMVVVQLLNMQVVVMVVLAVTLVHHLAK
jgi:hypothetical protein